MSPSKKEVNEMSKLHQSSISSFFRKSKSENAHAQVVSPVSSCLTPEHRKRSTHVAKAPSRSSSMRKNRLSLSIKKTVMNSDNALSSGSYLGESSPLPNVHSVNKTAHVSASMVGLSPNKSASKKKKALTHEGQEIILRMPSEPTIVSDLQDFSPKRKVLSADRQEQGLHPGNLLTPSSPKTRGIMRQVPHDTLSSRKKQNPQSLSQITIDGNKSCGIGKVPLSSTVPELEEHISRSPDIIPATPPDDKHQSKRTPRDLSSRQRILSSGSKSCSKSSKKPWDDEILRSVLHEMSSAKQAIGAPSTFDLLHSKDVAIPCSIVTPNASENVLKEVELGTLSTSSSDKVSSCMTSNLNSPLRRSPRKVGTPLQTFECNKFQATKLSTMTTSPKVSGVNQSPLQPKDPIDKEMADLHSIFGNSDNDLFLNFSSDEMPKAEIQDKNGVISSHCPTIPLRRSPRKSTNQIMEPKLASQDIFKEDLADLHLIFDNDNNALDQSLSVQDDTDGLDLLKAQVCKVESLVVNNDNQEAILCLTSCEKKAKCTVRGSWLTCPVYKGDVISVEARKVNGEWLVDDKAGMIVLNPDLLISGTTVVGSLFCSRRSVLSSLYGGMDSDSPIMVVGSIIHQLFQQALEEQKYKEFEIKCIAEKLISSKNCIKMLYASNMTTADILKELCAFYPRIASFMSTYVAIDENIICKRKRDCRRLAVASAPHLSCAKSDSQDLSSWKGKIVAIRDIEETFWEPRLGIKGMVDVSVDVEDASGKRKCMPLELKTGRASFSAEHKGQVNLYTMMMSRMELDVMSGLLLYLREGKMHEVTLSPHERKDLIMLRNTLSDYLVPRAPVIDKATGKFSPQHLPDPINFPSACQKCPYLTLCSVHLKMQDSSKLSAGHPMVSLSHNATQHLSEKHVEYVAHWIGLLQLEDMERLSSSKQKYFWRFTPEEREKNRQAITYLQLNGPGILVGGKYSHKFFHATSINSTSEKDFRKCGLSVGDYIVISTNKRLAVDRGRIEALSDSSVTVTSNKSLFEEKNKKIFHIDLFESNTLLVFNATNLGCLLDNSEQANFLRKVVIDRIIPTYTHTFSHSVISRCGKIFKRLNKKQRDAILMTLKADDYILIKGLPGTGKTATLVALVEVLNHMGMSVLITSHTHSAVDNLLLRLKGVGLQFLRLGADERIHPELLAFSESAITKHCKSPEDLEEVLSKQRIVGVTCLGAGHPLFSRGHMFDVCLVDESTQVSQPTVLRPLFYARRFVLIGDPHQLPPVVQSCQAQELGLSESLFSSLESSQSTVVLNINYRMNRVITEVANRLTYKGALSCGSDAVANATVLISEPQDCLSSWMSVCVSPDIENSVVFIDTREVSSSQYSTEKQESSVSNPLEVQHIVALIRALLERGVAAGEIGVMAPYRAQVVLLSQAVKDSFVASQVEVNTVDQFQGRDKQVILYSCTRNDGKSHHNPKEREILNDPRRLTVAITRAKHKLILIGHLSTLMLYAPFKKLLASLPQKCIVPLHMD